MSLPHGPTRIPPRLTPALDTLSSEEQEKLGQFLEKLNRKWFNAKNDAEGLHTHITLAWHTNHPDHAVFAASDKNFRMPKNLEPLRAMGFRGEILPPAEAVAFLRTVIEG